MWWQRFTGRVICWQIGYAGIQLFDFGYLDVIVTQNCGSKRNAVGENCTTNYIHTFVLISLSNDAMCPRGDILNLLFIECHIRFHIQTFLNEIFSAHESVQHLSERKINRPLNYANRLRLCKYFSLAWQLNSLWKRAIIKFVGNAARKSGNKFENQLDFARSNRRCLSLSLRPFLFQSQLRSICFWTELAKYFSEVVFVLFCLRLPMIGSKRVNSKCVNKRKI